MYGGFMDFQPVIPPDLVKRPAIYTTIICEAGKQAPAAKPQVNAVAPAAKAVAPAVDPSKPLTVPNLGAFKSITFPIGWHEVPNPSNRPFHSLSTFTASDPDLRINLLWANLPANAEDVPVFHELLDANKTGEPKIIFTDGDAISDDLHRIFHHLMPLIGHNHVGNNQLAQNTKSEQLHPPIFHVTKATLSQLKGKNLLLIDGYYQGEDGTPLDYDRSLFISYADEFGVEIHHIAFTCKDQSKFNAALPVFEQVLSSIVWSQTAKP
jgi:hypothetical protein